MQSTCISVDCMAKTLQIRNVPDSVHRTFKMRAAAAGMSLSDYLLSELKPMAERKTVAEVGEWMRSRHPPLVIPEGEETIVESIRRMRDA